MTDELKTIENRDRDFAQTFLQFGGIDPESRQGKGGIEILVRALNEAREEGRREEWKRRGCCGADVS